MLLCQSRNPVEAVLDGAGADGVRAVLEQRDVRPDLAGVGVLLPERSLPGMEGEKANPWMRSGYAGSGGGVRHAE